MSLYLQRLLDRAAGAALEAAPAGPLAISSSPIVGFDQRLGDPALAADFSLLGASPEAEPGEADDLAQETPAPARPRSPAEPAFPAAAAPAAPDAVAAGQHARAKRGVRKEERGVRPLDGRAHALPADPAASPAPTARAVADPPAASKPVATPALATVAPHPPIEGLGGAGREQRGVAAAPPSLPRQAPAEPVPDLPTALPKQRPDVSADIAFRAAPPAPAPAPRSAATPPSPARPDAASAGAPPAPAEAAAATAAEPIVAAPQPLPVTPAALQAADVARIVRETLRTERAAEPPAAAPPQPPGSERPADGPRARDAARPTTADEASVIGKLESSRYRPMLFGVRRR